MGKDRIIDFDREFELINSNIRPLCQNIDQIENDIDATSQEIDGLIHRAEKLANEVNIALNMPLSEVKKTETIKELNCIIDGKLGEDISENNYQKFPKLSSIDVIISSISGLVAVVIDCIFVGTPDIVKIYKGGEKFDGSILTAAIRNIGNGPLASFAERLSEICKVPYDISAVKDGMYPQNHRLRSLSHDPFFGLFFAVFDIVMNTTTFIDNAGQLRIIPNTTFPITMKEKILSVFYYIGHIISDIFTQRGIPIPGFFMTQFFTNGTLDNSISKIAERMYLNGYDMRHLVSMSVPVVVKRLILDAYIELTQENRNNIFSSMAEKELIELEVKLKKEKMMFVSNSIMIGGNIAKFFAPPSCGNPCALNAAEWFEFLSNSIRMVKVMTRDVTGEQAIQNRRKINEGWGNL